MRCQHCGLSVERSLSHAKREPGDPWTGDGDLYFTCEPSAHKRIHLLSGGIDSTVMLYESHHLLSLCLSFNYGQAHAMELEFAAHHARALGVPHEVISIPQLRGSSLTDGAGGFVVPNRNAILLNVAANIAAARGFETISYACTLDDADDFPDCTPYFLKCLNECLAAAGCEVEILAPYINQSKRQVVETGRRLGVNFSQTWSCYAGAVSPCGRCKACESRARALAA